MIVLAIFQVTLPSMTLWGKLSYSAFQQWKPWIPLLKHIKLGQGITCASRWFVCMNAVSIWSVLSKIVSPADDQMDCLWSRRWRTSKHTDVRRPAKAKDGRKWKKRCPAKLNDIVVNVLKTKSWWSDAKWRNQNRCKRMWYNSLVYVSISCYIEGCRGRTKLTAKSIEKMTPY